MISKSLKLVKNKLRIVNTTMIKMHDGKGEFLAWLALLMPNGSAFQSFGAARVKERSPSVAFHLKRG